MTGVFPLTLSWEFCVKLSKLASYWVYGDLMVKVKKQAIRLAYIEHKWQTAEERRRTLTENDLYYGDLNPNIRR